MVQGLFPFVVSTTQARAALAAYGVDLVDKDDGGSGLFGLLKEVPDPAGAYAHVQLHKIRAGDGQERHAGLAGHRFGQQGFTGAGRAHQQNPLGDSGAQDGVLGRVLEEVHDLLQFTLLLLGPGHVVEGDLFLHLVRRGELGLAELGQAAVVPGVVLAHQHHQDQEHHHQRQDGGQQREPVDGLGVLLVVVVGKGAVGLLLLNQVVQVAVEGVEAGDGAGGLLLAVQRLLQLHLYHVVLDGKRLHLLRLEQLNHPAVTDAGGASAAGQIPEQGDQGQNQDQVEDIIPMRAFSQWGITSFALLGRRGYLL